MITLTAVGTTVIAVVDTVPLGVDTPADLERARQLLANGPASDTRLSP